MEELEASSIIWTGCSSKSLGRLLMSFLRVLFILDGEAFHGSDNETSLVVLVAEQDWRGMKFIDVCEAIINCE